MSFGPAAAAPLIIARKASTEQCGVYLCLCILYLITPALFSTNIYTFCLDTKDFGLRSSSNFTSILRWKHNILMCMSSPCLTLHLSEVLNRFKKYALPCTSAPLQQRAAARSQLLRIMCIYLHHSDDVKIEERIYSTAQQMCTSSTRLQ